MCVIMIEKGASKTSGWSVCILYIYVIHGAYTVLRLHQNISMWSPQEGNNAAFLNSMELMWWLPWTLLLRRLINVALVIKILPIFLVTLFQKMTQHHWSNMHSFSTVVKWKHDTKIIVSQRWFSWAMFSRPHLRPARAPVPSPQKAIAPSESDVLAAERRTCYWRSVAGRHVRMEAMGFLKI